MNPFVATKNLIGKCCYSPQGLTEMVILEVDMGKFIVLLHLRAKLNMMIHHEEAAAILK